MQRRNQKVDRSRGFTLVEFLIIISLTLIFLLGTSSLFYLSVRSSTKAGLVAQAKALSQEGMEAIVAIRDIGGSQWNWSSTPVNTSSNEYYQPYLASTWLLGNKSSTQPIPTMGAPFNVFTRFATIEAVQRGVGCGSQVCPIVSAGGIVDNNTRKIIVTVRWQEQDGFHFATTSSYLTRWR